MSKKKTSAAKSSKHLDIGQHSGGSFSKIIAVTHKNEGQKNALRLISQNKVTIISGSPGTGKSHVAVGWGLQEMLMHSRFEKLIFTRPVVEAGESLGYLPGDANAKIAPYMMPIMDILEHYLSHEEIDNMVKERKIVIMPLAYMRGITFRNAYVVADEMQNSTAKQMHLLLTRIGEKSKIVITGDTDQSDLYQNRSSTENGLQDAIDRLVNIKDIGLVELGYESCVRDPLVNDIDAAYRPRRFRMPIMKVSYDASAEVDSEDPRIFDHDAL